MIGITHDHTGLVTGITLNQTTYSAAALELLVSRLERAESAAAQAETVIAMLNEQLADREQDLTYEYEARVAAETLHEAEYEMLTQFAWHDEGCPSHGVSGGQPCNCGYRSASEQIIVLLAAAAQAPAATPYAAIVALGRATLAYEQARARRDAEGRDVGTAAAYHAVQEARAAYLTALAACQEARPDA